MSKFKVGDKVRFIGEERKCITWYKLRFDGYDQMNSNRNIVVKNILSDRIRCLLPNGETYVYDESDLIYPNSNVKHFTPKLIKRKVNGADKTILIVKNGFFYIEESTFMKTKTLGMILKRISKGKSFEYRYRDFCWYVEYDKDEPKYVKFGCKSFKISALKRFYKYLIELKNKEK